METFTELSEVFEDVERMEIVHTPGLTTSGSRGSLGKHKQYLVGDDDDDGNIVKAVLAELIQSPFICNEAMKELYLKGEVSSVTSSLLWMNDCIIGKGNREKAWAAFHKAITQHRPAIGLDKEAINLQAGSILALHLMIKLVQLNFPLKNSWPSDTQVELNDEEIDILGYISGFLLRRLNTFTFADIFHSATKDCSTLTGLFDRGGLIHPSNEFVAIVKVMEMVFRSLPTTSADKLGYYTSLDDKDVPLLIKRAVADLEVQDEELESFYNKLVSLYFNVRMHQKCKFLLNELSSQRKTGRKSKALRDSL